MDESNGGTTGDQFGPHLELEEVTLDTLQQALKEKELTSRDLVAMYLNRVTALDQNGPRLRSIIETNPDVLEIAEIRDRGRVNEEGCAPLLGVPILLKDSIGTTGNMATGAGSLALADVRPSRDAFVVKQLKAAGAIMFGKANMSEWANFRSTRSTSGWSARGGLGLNPYALDSNTSGSSSGSASAVAANLVSVALGTETDGSILCPASVNGVVGLKPTVGLTSRSGVIPISSSQDTVGPIARTVADAVAVLNVIVGRDPSDPYTNLVPHGAIDYTTCLDPTGLKGARIGVPRDVFWGYSPDADKIADEALDTMRVLGAEIVDPADIPTAHLMKNSWPPTGDSILTMLLYEFKASLNAYLKDVVPTAEIQSLEDLIAFNERHAGLEMPYFGQELLTMAQSMGPLSDLQYIEARQRNYRISREEGIDAVMDKFALDALVVPTTSPAWKTDLVNGGGSKGNGARPTALAGYPAISVPAGEAYGLPVGITIMGRAYSESVLIRLAYAFEQATQYRRAPRYEPLSAYPSDART